MVKALPMIGKPALRALTKVGLTDLEALSQVSAGALSALHGIGPKAIKQLEEALTKEGLAFGPEQALPLDADFLMLGDLACDNAPKKRVIREFLLAAWMQEADLSGDYLSPKAEFSEAGQDKPLMGLQTILTAYQAADQISSLVLHKLLSHGKEGAVHATLHLQTGQEIHFAEFYQFEGHRKDAKLLKITRYQHSSSAS